MPAVFFDRDNTLIANDGDLGDPALVKLLPGVGPAVASVRGLGFKVVVVTNQGGVARGKYSEADVERVHERLSELVRAGANGAAIDGFYFCPYHPEGTVEAYRCEHALRKPRPGMLLKAAQEMGLDLSRSWMVGDQMRDIEAGKLAGVRTVLLTSEADSMTPLDVARPGEVEDGDLAGNGGVGGPTAGSRGLRGGGLVKPDYLASHLIDAVRIIAHQRQPVSAREGGEDSDDTVRTAGRKWDAAAVARLQRSAGRVAEGGKVSGREGSAGGSERGGEGTAVSRGLRGEEDAEAARRFRPVGAPGLGGDRPVAEPGYKKRLKQVMADAKERRRQSAERAMEAEEVPTEASDAEAEVDERDREVLEPGVAAEPRLVMREPGAGGAGEEARVLRQILQELRSGRSGREFTATTVFGIVLQIVAVVCLAAGLWLGGENEAELLRWLGTAVVAQGVSLAVLVLDR